MKDYDYFRETYEKTIESYVALHNCYLHGVTLDGELELEEPNGRTLIVNVDGSILYRNDTQLPVVESTLTKEQLEFLEFMVKVYKELSDIEKVAVNDLSELEYAVNEYVKGVK